MIQDSRSRGKAFREILGKLVVPERRIGDDIFMFDDYTVNPLLKKSFKAGYTFGVVVTAGGGTVSVNSVSYRFQAPCLVILLPDQVVQYDVDPDQPAQSKVIVISETFMQELYSMALRMNEIFSTLMVNPIVQLEEGSAKSMGTFVDACVSIVGNVGNEQRLNSLKFLILALFYGSLNTLFERQDQSGKARAASLCAEFMKLMREHFREHHSLGFYADRLCITERYLYMTVKSVTGKSASYWIDWYLLSESKNLLDRQELSVQQISDELNFVSQSNFGKFFKRLTGLSPLAYRKQKY